jgi:hypothetical protein
LIDRRKLRTLVVPPLAVAVALVLLAACDNPVASTLRRPSDPVVLSGDDLPRVGGVSPGDVVAFRRRNNAWQQIPVQVDERHTVNLGVVHNQAPEVASDYLVYSDPGTLAGADPVASVDSDDEIVFMAADAGGRAGDDVSEPSGVLPGSGFEFTITDPVDGDARGFVYLFRRVPGSGLDPSAGLDYAQYDFQLLTDRNGDGDREYPEDYDFFPSGNVVGDPPGQPPRNANPENSTITTAAYTVHFDGRWREDGLSIRAGGAAGVDILDRHKVFPYTGPDDPSPQPPPSCVRTEDTGAAGHGAFVGNIDGPVRVIRDYLGFNSGKYTQRRHVFYANRQDTTTFLRVHPLPDGPDSTFDYSDAAIGMTYRNSRNTAGVQVDGSPDTVVAGEPAWEQVTGAQGTVTHVHELEIVPTRPGVPLPVITSFYADDATPDFVQCTGDAKAIATSGLSIVPPGVLDSDPRPRGGPGHDYDFTARRTQFYDGPNQPVAAALERDAWARNPLTVTFARFEP